MYRLPGLPGTTEKSMSAFWPLPPAGSRRACESFGNSREALAGPRRCFKTTKRQQFCSLPTRLTQTKEKEVQT